MSEEVIQSSSPLDTAASVALGAMLVELVTEGEVITLDEANRPVGEIGLLVDVVPPEVEPDVVPPLDVLLVGLDVTDADTGLRSMIVPVALAVPRKGPPVGDDNVTVNVSLLWLIVAPLTATVTYCVSTPGAKVNIPLPAV
jgi:hypothetical protein